MSADTVQFNMANECRLRVSIAKTTEGDPYVGVNVMIDGEWLGMKRLLTWV